MAEAAASSSSSSSVVVVGSANYDLFAYMARFPKLGQTIHGTRAGACGGGKGMNQCCMSARMGAPTAMVACVGDDAFGATIKAAWAEGGVDISHVRTAPEGVATGQAQIWVDDEGNNSIVVIAGANAELSPADVQAAEPLIASAAVVVCQLEVPRATTLAALRLAKKHGVLSILNPAPAAADLEPELLRLASIVCPNETELSVLTGGLPVDSLDEIQAAARQLLVRLEPTDAAGGPAVLVTLGAKGALLLDGKGEMTLIPCPAVARVVDTSGAGDCFLGSLAAYLSRGVALAEATARACRVASLSVQRAGTQTSYPRSHELPSELRLPEPPPSSS